MEPFIGEIRLFGFNYAPMGWAFCQGQLLPIPQYTALYALLGTTFGGDGKSTFGLPNLAGVAPVDAGQGTNLTRREMGKTGGSATVALALNQMASHQHAPNAAAAAGTVTSPSGAIWATAGATRGMKMYSGVAGSNPQMNTQLLQNTGGNQAHNNLQPYLPLNFCIALTGIFPVRP